MQQTSLTKGNDEIDLIALIHILWKNKIRILLTTFVFTAIAAVYAFTAKEKWTSSSEVIPPSLNDSKMYISLRNEYSRILGKEFDFEKVNKELWNDFILQVGSGENRKDFFINSELYKTLSEGKDESAKLKLLNTLVYENFNIIKPDSKKNPDSIEQKITFSAETAGDAQRYLGKLILDINHKTVKYNLDNFGVMVRETLDEFKAEMKKIEQELKFQKEVRLINLNQALAIAKTAEIKEYSKAINGLNPNEKAALIAADAQITLPESKLGDSTYLFMLGEKYLQAQVEVLNKMDIVYPPRYYQLQEYLIQLESILTKIGQVKAQAFTYLSSPDYPVTIDYPKRWLVLILGVILGLFISSLYFMICSLIAKNNQFSTFKDL